MKQENVLVLTSHSEIRKFVYIFNFFHEVSVFNSEGIFQMKINIVRFNLTYWPVNCHKRHFTINLKKCQVGFFMNVAEIIFEMCIRGKFFFLKFWTSCDFDRHHLSKCIRKVGQRKIFLVSFIIECNWFWKKFMYFFF